MVLHYLYSGHCVIISSTIIFLFQPADHFLITVFHCISRHGEPGPGGPKFDICIDVPAGSFPFYKVKNNTNKVSFFVQVHKDAINHTPKF